jgi:hypothetical protein
MWASTAVSHIKIPYYLGWLGTNFLKKNCQISEKSVLAMPKT